MPNPSTLILGFAGALIAIVLAAQFLETVLAPY